MSGSGEAILPGGRLGVMGGGQLGRMFVAAARRMGYRTAVFSPEANGPAGQWSDSVTVGDYRDESAVRAFAAGCDAVTFEFENIPAESVAWVEAERPVRPAGRVLHVAQNREREKRFLAGAGIPVAPFAVVDSAEGAAEALAAMGGPAVLKTADFGYDGKGQVKLAPGDDVGAAWLRCGGGAAAFTAVLEGWVDFEAELSVIVARGSDGAVASFPATRNDHARHILDISSAPFGDPAVERQAREVAEAVARGIGVVGLLAVEMFLRRDGAVAVNEIAPRPHNSGHWTIEGCATSQFEQQVRAVAGLPLGSTELVRPSAMANLLGDLWEGGEPRWAAALAVPGVALHLYGKAEARPGRKMGHLTATAASAEEAAARVREARERLRA
jgi:5-(carboxyamino)imidazole ribonucleotide synthase